jgi:Escherichia/Staphylococcus phage prohead protease
MNRVTERRANFGRVRLRAATNSDSAGVITGYASVYSKPGDRIGLSGDLGGFFERVSPGCFRAALQRPDDVRCNFNHSPDQIVARTKAGTLKLWEDRIGLGFEANVANTSVGRDLVENIRNGNVTGTSFAFQPDDDSWGEEDDPDDPDQRIQVRSLKSVHLLDISPCVFPAYDDANVTLGDTRLAPEKILGRSIVLPLTEMFPGGVPAEIRSRFPNITQRSATDSVSRRRSLVNRVLGL